MWSKGFSSNSAIVDLSGDSSKVNLQLQPIEGGIFHGTVRGQQGERLPFAFLSAGTAAPVAVSSDSGQFQIPVPGGRSTGTVTAPGYYARALVLDASASDEQEIVLVRRPETRVVSWGSGQLVVPPETTGTLNDRQMDLTSGWFWGVVKPDKPLSIRMATQAITISEGEFALEQLPGRAAWFYLASGRASIGRSEEPPVMVSAGQMVMLADSGDFVPVNMDAVGARVIRSISQVPLFSVWEPTLGARVRDTLAQAGIGLAQAVTFGTYAMAVLLLVGGPLAWLGWRFRLGRKELTHL